MPADSMSAALLHCCQHNAVSSRIYLPLHIQDQRGHTEILTGQSTTETQNHWMVEVVRDLWRSSGPPPLLKQGHLEEVAQDLVQTDGFWRAPSRETASVFKHTCFGFCFNNEAEYKANIQQMKIMLKIHILIEQSLLNNQAASPVYLLYEHYHFHIKKDCV